MVNTKKTEKGKTLAYGYSSESTRRELSNEYKHDRVELVFRNRPFGLGKSSLNIGMG